jgi:EGF-like domain
MEFATAVRQEFSIFHRQIKNFVVHKGECECDLEYSGKTCECSKLKTNCIAPDSNEVCSGHGSCECNECQCDPLRFGKFCESSPGNESSLCIFYEPCVQCVINRKLERECSDFKDKCTSRNGDLYKSEFYDDISGEKRPLPHFQFQFHFPFSSFSHFEFFHPKLI